MSNLERDPAELLCDYIEAATDAGIEVLEARAVPLGGPRAMTVHRTLPQRQRSTIGAWCFVDHYGPDDVSATGGMVVPPHPHTALQTASWLFDGEIEHRDSVGSHAMVRPGELNLMTAGRGISHSEVSTPTTTVLHGVQLWIALPDDSRQVQPFFEARTAVATDAAGATIRVFVGSLAGVTAEASVFTPLLGAQIDLGPHARLELEVDPAFEHGVLVDVGPVTVACTTADAAIPIPRDTALARTELGYLSPGKRTITLTAGEHGARVLLLGGEPFPEQIVMWWNFIGRTHEDIVEARGAWQSEAITGSDPAGRFGHVNYDGSALPAPVLPTVRLRPRD